MEHSALDLPNALQRHDVDVEIYDKMGYKIASTISSLPLGGGIEN